MRIAGSLLAALGAAALAPAASLAAKPATTLYVSPSGSDSGKCTQDAPCKTISHAVTRAKSGDTVSVASGTYAEDVRITKAVTVAGAGPSKPVVDATGLDNGFLIDGPQAAGATVRNFVVENATFEGILAQRTSNVTIANDAVRHNDLGEAAPNPVGECAPQGEVPGDCGEGIHLMSVTGSHVTHSRVTHNSGGILLTDELGPTARNHIARNRVNRNLLDCGITLASHSSSAVSSGGAPQPTKGGVYSNAIARNVANGNGTRGEGAGILLAAAGPGGAVYDNLVKRNTANANGFAGVTLHSHTPGQDLNGNRIVGNRLRHDNVNGDPDAGVAKTTGILLFSAQAKVTGTVVKGNRLSREHFGIWAHNLSRIRKDGNRFSHVAVPLHQG